MAQHQLLNQYVLVLSVLSLLFSGGVYSEKRRQSNKYELIVTRQVCDLGTGHCRTRRERPLPLNNPVPTPPSPVDSETCPAPPPPPTPPPPAVPLPSPKPWFGKPELLGLILGALAGALVTIVPLFVAYFLFVLVTTLIEEHRQGQN